MGEGYLGSLGQGDFDPRPQFTPISTLSSYEIKDLAAGWAHTAVITTCGRLFLFGRPHDVRKALSLRHMWQTFPFLVKLNQAMKRVFDSPSKDGQAYYREDVLLKPREFPLPKGEVPRRVACSGALTAVVTESGRVFCMGNNVFGQCGLGAGSGGGGGGGGGGKEEAEKSDVLLNQEEEGTVVKKQRLATADAANVWTPNTAVTGLNDYDEDDGDNDSNKKGVDDPVVDVAVGFQHVIARTAKGKAWAWGKGERGQLGNGANVNHNSAFPIDLPEGSKVVKVASGFNHSVALTEEGAVWVWGKWQGLQVKEAREGGGLVDLYEDQLLPREVDVMEAMGGEGGSGWVVEDVACGHFHTSLLLSKEGGKEGKEQRLFMFGMRAQVRTMEPMPTPVALPPVTTKGGAGGGEWCFGKGGAMTHTVLLWKDAGAGGKVREAYKVEFEGEGTMAVPVCSEEELLLGGGEEEEDEKKRVVVHYTEGLAHRLALVE